MLVNITRDLLVAALQHVLKAVPANSPIPILSGINIQAHADGLTLTTSNTSLKIEYRIPLHSNGMTIQKTGGIVVPARYFNEIIRKLSDGMITLEIKERLILTIKSGNSQVRLCGMDAAEFPLSSHEEQHPVNRLRIHNSLLKSTVRQVSVAASRSETRPVLTGVSFQYNEESVSLIATDGIRLASRTIPVHNNINIGSNVIVPWRNLFEISKMLSDKDDTTEIEVGAHQIRFRSNELLAQSVLIEGTFPSIQNVIPQTCLSEILVETVGLLRAVERVSVFASESVIRIAVTSSKLDLLSKTTEIGDVEDEVPVEEMNGADFTLSLNGKLLIDILRCVDSKYMRLRFTGKVSPLVLLPSDSDSYTLFLITPVRTPD